ncbi:MAG: Rne/Rng family ribonuclease [Roseobacter sp.]
MAKKMLIDATHAEETRVVVVDGNKVEEFDFESENKRQLAGNIYLAKVTRVEPSLQAAFVDYGGNRHGFLAFSEIHPDYYQIPVADRQALMEEERAYAEAQKAKEEDDEKPKRRRSRSRTKTKAEETASDDAVVTKEVKKDEIDGMETIDLADDQEGLSPMETVAETPVEEPSEETDVQASDADAAPETAAEEVLTEVSSENKTLEEEVKAVEGEEAALEEAPTEVVSSDETTPEATSKDGAVEADGETAAEAPDQGAAPEHDEDDEDAPRKSDASSKDDSIESVADDDDHEDIRPARKPRPRRYKIQEVIKVRQILLVQVVKEERGNKGAALTTYLSLAGRYCVLMPNTARGGGISRKITNAADRKKLKEIANEIEVPQGAGLIVRTAGAKRTKAEIKRDYEYLQRLWEQIRELTLKSIAPSKIYEEGDLIKRSIRDLYNRDIDEVFVEGERGYRTAKDFMKMIMPSHAKNVKQYAEGLPLFARYQVESYLASMFNPTVQLPSGGYIVIGVTEALVAVDVNSGRATKEGSIEQTALKTNLEAADEVARQLRLRDLAGLIVIDFIDMDERKNNLSVEKRMKEKLKTDRARIQVGRISGFGLMEMSRQRLRPGMIEATTQPCQACHGTGLIRSDDNLALSILRQIEEEGTRKRSREVLIKAPVGIANFLMNQKREHIAQIEGRYGLSVRVEGDPVLVSPDFSLEKFKTATRVVTAVAQPVVSVDTSLMDQVDNDDADVEEDIEVSSTGAEEQTPDADGEARPKRRRRRRRRSRNKNAAGEGQTSEGQTVPEGETKPDGVVEAEAPVNEDKVVPAAETETAEVVVSEPVTEEAVEVEAKPKRTRSRTRKPKVAPKAAEEDVVTADETPAASEAASETPVVEDKPAKPKRKRASRAKKVVDVPMAEDAVSEPVAATINAVADVEPAAKIETVPEAPVLEAPAAVPEVATSPEPAPVASAVTEDVAVVEEEPAPAKPKRRGWWSLGG